MILKLVILELVTYWYPYQYWYRYLILVYLVLIPVLVWIPIYQYIVLIPDNGFFSSGPIMVLVPVSVLIQHQFSTVITDVFGGDIRILVSLLDLNQYGYISNS